MAHFDVLALVVASLSVALVSFAALVTLLFPSAARVGRGRRRDTAATPRPEETT